MAKSINTCTFSGNIGKVGDLRYTAKGDAVINLRMAVNGWKKDEEPMWIGIVAFGKKAEVIGDYVKKGSLLFVTGELQVREYESNGEKRTSVEIVCSDFAFGGSREGGDRSDRSDGSTRGQRSNSSSSADYAGQF